MRRRGNGRVSSKCISVSSFALSDCLTPGTRFVPRYFEPDISTGIPKLTEEGRKAIQEELAEDADHRLEDSAPTPQVERANLAEEAVQA